MLDVMAFVLVELLKMNVEYVMVIIQHVQIVQAFQMVLQL